MPKVKILKNVIAGKKSCKAGDEVTVTDREARNLIHFNKAELIQEEAPAPKKKFVKGE